MSLIKKKIEGTKEIDEVFRMQANSLFHFDYSGFHANT